MLLNLWNYLNTHKGSHWITRVLRNPQHEEDHLQLVLAVFLIVAVILFALVFVSIISNGFWTHFNNATYNLFQTLHQKYINHFMITMSLLGDKHVLLIMAGIILVWLLFQRRWWSALHWTSITLVSVAAIEFLKRLVDSPRPPKVVLMDPTSSFPSGHTVLSVTLFGFLAVMIAKNLPEKRRWIPFTIALILVGLIAFSRISLGAHWLSDILGSLLLGLILVLATTMSYLRRTLQPILVSKFAVLAIIAISVVWIGYSYFEYNDLEAEFITPWPTQSTMFNTWWKQTPGQIAFYRTSRTGHPAQPLNIQWYEPLTNIQQFLQVQGWVNQSPKLNLQNTITRLTTTKDQQHLPILPMLYHNRSPVLLMTKPSGDNQTLAVIRLWQSDMIIDKGEIPLWFGIISYQPAKLATARISRDQPFLSAIDILLPDIKKDRSTKWKLLEIPQDQQPQEMQHLNWDGEILLIRKNHVFERRHLRWIS